MAYTNLQAESSSQTPVELEFPYLNLNYVTAALAFNMERQTQSNWCWAATSKSVSYFYSALTPWTQCKVAGSELNKTCCTTPVPSVCNVPWYLDRALTRTGNFVSMQGGTISYARIKQELDRGLVVGTRIGWNGGGGHFMVIYGVAKIGFLEYLYIDDPIYGKSFLTYAQFATNYKGSGRWTHTYFTKKRFYIMWKKEPEINAKLLKPIAEIRPLTKINDPKYSPSQQLSEPQLSMPHYNYVIGLNDIHNETRLPENPVSLRVLELESSEPQAIYEVGLDENNPQFLQVQSDKEYFNELENALDKLKQNANQEVTGEIRHIRVPALNVEAAWLHYEDEQPDKFTIIRQFANDNNKVLTEKEFTAYLNTLKSQMGDMDDLMGA